MRAARADASRSNISRDFAEMSDFGTWRRRRQGGVTNEGDSRRRDQAFLLCPSCITNARVVLHIVVM